MLFFKNVDSDEYTPKLLIHYVEHSCLPGMFADYNVMVDYISSRRPKYLLFIKISDD